MHYLLPLGISLISFLFRIQVHPMYDLSYFTKRCKFSLDRNTNQLRKGENWYVVICYYRTNKCHYMVRCERSIYGRPKEKLFSKPGVPHHHAYMVHLFNEKLTLGISIHVDSIKSYFSHLEYLTLVA